MDKMLTHDYLELLNKLTSITNDHSLNRQFKINIRKLHNALTEEVKYSELYEFVCETSPNLSSCIDTVDFVSNNELCELFVLWILFLLEFYSLCLTKEMRKYRIKCKHNVNYALKNYAPDVLTQSESVSFNLAMDFIFILGIAPQLFPNIYDSTNKSYDMIMKSFRVLPNINKNINLLKKSLSTTIDLFETKMSIIFKEYIIANHFQCYLLALIQICFCPDTKMRAGWHNQHVHVDGYPIYLKSLIDQAPRKFIFRALISLLGSNHAITPHWLAESSGLFIRDCIMREEGVKSFILSYVDDYRDQLTYQYQDSNNKPSSIDWEKCNLMSKMIINCPLGDISGEVYCASVFEQIDKLIKALYYADPSTTPCITKPNNRSIAPIFVNIMSSLWEEHQSLFDEIILKNVASPLYLCTKEFHPWEFPMQSDDEYRLEVINEYDFSISIETLYEILIMFKRPKSKFCLCLLPLIDVLFELHAFVSTNPSYLYSSVESLLLETMNLVNGDQSLSLIKYFAELENFDPKLFSGWQAIKPMNKLFKFSSGVAGGIKIVLTRKCIIDENCNDSIFKAINWKISLLTNLIHNMENITAAKNISHSCVQNLTKVIFQNIETGFTFQWTLGHQWLMLLTGILEKGEIIDGDWMDEIFLFAKVVIEKTLNYYKNYKGVKCDYLTDDDFQRESLSLVLGLLSCFVLERDEIPQFVLHLSKDMVSPLKCLYTVHPDEDIQTLIFELIRTITAYTQGHVIKNQKNPTHTMSRDKVKEHLSLMKERNLIKDIQFSLGQNIPLSIQSTCSVTDAGLKSRALKIFNIVKPSELPPRGQGEGLLGMEHETTCNSFNDDTKESRVYCRKKRVQFLDGCQTGINFKGK